MFNFGRHINDLDSPQNLFHKCYVLSVWPRIKEQEIILFHSAKDDLVHQYRSLLLSSDLFTNLCEITITARFGEEMSDDKKDKGITNPKEIGPSSIKCPMLDSANYTVWADEDCCNTRFSRNNINAKNNIIINSEIIINSRL